MSATSFALWCLLAFVQLSEQQKNPINDFCRRFAHQTAVVDRKLYIDGGLVNWNPIAQNNANSSNTWLLYNDLNTSVPNVGQPQIHANLSKNGSIPDVSGGALWADEVNKRLFSFGGDYFQTQPQTYNLYSYDVLNNVWDNFGPPGASINSVSYGGSASVSEIGKGYIYGGWASNSSIPGWSGESVATTGLIEYDMDTGSWTNSSGPDAIPRAEGVMVYIPASISGVLVYFGGITAPAGNVTPEEMTNIHVYDIQSSKWYTQTASGDVPPNRKRFCAGATWADDQSSYNIYLYGGLGFGTNATGFDDVYILSLPSFTWIKWWPTSPGTSNPHNSLSCNVIDRGQMIIIGGKFPLVDSCDSPESWGTHNLNLGQENSGGSMWYKYQPNITSYTVPSAILSVVGGGPTGGATATAPAKGFDNRDLSVYFTQKATAADRTPTRSVSAVPSGSSKSLSSGAIAGIAIGSTAGALALLIGAFCLFRRHKNKKRQHQQAFAVAPYGQSPHSQHYAFPAQSTYSGHSPSSPQVTEYQQLPANSISMPPAELAGIDHVPVKSPKYGLYQQEPAEHDPAYGTWPHSPGTQDTRDSRGLDGSQVPENSPTPTYASMGHSPQSTNFSQAYFPR